MNIESSIKKGDLTRLRKVLTLDYIKTAGATLNATFPLFDIYASYSEDRIVYHDWLLKVAVGKSFQGSGLVSTTIKLISLNGVFCQCTGGGEANSNTFPYDITVCPFMENWNDGGLSVDITTEGCNLGNLTRGEIIVDVLYRIIPVNYQLELED